MLYKYFSSSAGQRFLSTGKLRFSQPNLFNDPFELQPLVRISGDKLLQDYIDPKFDTHVAKMYAENPQIANAGLSIELFASYARLRRPEMNRLLAAWIPQIGQFLQEQMAATFSEHIGIFCLSETPLNLLMWAHYSSSHTGLCIGFDGHAPFFNRRRSAHDEFCHLRRVRYSHRRPKIELTDRGTEFDDVLTKSVDWRYEREWRMLMPLDLADEMIDVKPSPIALFSCPLVVVREVIFGARASEQTQKAILDWYCENEAAHHIRMRSAVLSKEHYRLDLHPLVAEQRRPPVSSS